MIVGKGKNKGFAVLSRVNLDLSNSVNFVYPKLRPEIMRLQFDITIFCPNSGMVVYLNECNISVFKIHGSYSFESYCPHVKKIDEMGNPVCVPYEKCDESVKSIVCSVLTDDSPRVVEEALTLFAENNCGFSTEYLDDEDTDKAKKIIEFLTDTYEEDRVNISDYEGIEKFIANRNK